MKEFVAGNGLLDRQLFLRHGAALGFAGFAFARSSSAETLPKVRMPNRDGFIVRFPERL